MVVTIDVSIPGHARKSPIRTHDRKVVSGQRLRSLIETAKINGINPDAWLTETLTKLVNRWPQSRIDELMPWAYAKTTMQAVNV